MATAVKKRKTPAQAIEDYRVEQYVSLGFSGDDALALARAIDGRLALDWHKVAKMLEGGCSHELAMKILT